MKLSVHKRYTKVPRVREKAFESNIYITDRQRSILRDAWHRSGKPFIVAPGYNEFLNALGVTMPLTETVVAHGRGWRPKRLFSVDFGLPEPHPMEYMIRETINDEPEGDAPWWPGHRALIIDPMEDSILNAMREIRKQDPESFRREYLHIPVPELPEDPEERSRPLPRPMVPKHDVPILPSSRWF